MRKFFTILFDGRNLLTTITIVVGLLGVFGLPQNLGFSNEQIIIGLLSFLAIEGLLVKLFYLEEVQKSVREIKHKTTTPNIDTILIPRNKQFELADYIDQAKEILICGVSLENLVMSQGNMLANMAKTGCKLHFVTINPHVNFLDSIDLGMPNYVGHQVINANIRSGLTRLGQLHHSLPVSLQEQIDIRTYAGIPFYSAVRVLNNDAKKSVIWVSFYTYGGDIGERRGILCRMNDSPQNFEFYNQSLDKLWLASTAVDFSEEPFSV